MAKNNMSKGIDAIKARLAAATPGPWRHEMFSLAMSITANHNKPKIKIIAQESLGEMDDEYSEEDYELIAHAPTDIAKLIEAYEVLRECLLAMDGICDREMSYDDHCKENGGRLTCPIAEIKGAIKVWRNDAFKRADEILGGE